MLLQNVWMLEGTVCTLGKAVNFQVPTTPFYVRMEQGESKVGNPTKTATIRVERWVHCNHATLTIKTYDYLFGTNPLSKSNLMYSESSLEQNSHSTEIFHRLCSVSTCRMTWMMWLLPFWEDTCCCEVVVRKKSVGKSILFITGLINS